MSQTVVGNLVPRCHTIRQHRAHVRVREILRDNKERRRDVAAREQIQKARNALGPGFGIVAVGRKIEFSFQARATTGNTIRALLEQNGLPYFAVASCSPTLGPEWTTYHSGGVTELRVDGGACINNLLMQFQADLLGIPVVRPKVIETTALGAAYLAGLSCGVYSNLDQLAAHWQAELVPYSLVAPDLLEEVYVELLPQDKVRT